MAVARRFCSISFWVFPGTWFVFGVACASPEQQLPAVKSAPPVASSALPVADAGNEASRTGSLQREQQKIELPWASNAMDPVEAPTVSVLGREIVVDNESVDQVLEEVAKERKLRRHDGLFLAMKQRREAWKRLHPGDPFPGVVLFRFDRRELSAVVKSVFQTAAFAGFPNASFVVNRRDGSGLGRLNADARVPLPPDATEPARSADARLELTLRSLDSCQLVWTGGTSVRTAIERFGWSQASRSPCGSRAARVRSGCGRQPRTGATGRADGVRVQQLFTLP